MREYFGTDGIRGQVGKFPITPDFALKLGYAAGKVLAAHGGEKPAVIIGKDTRASGYLFESSLEAGLVYAGIDVYMAGPLPTPAIAYLTKALRLSAGIVISASHNPYSDNGIKFFSSQGTKLSDNIELEIEKCLAEEMIIAKTLGRVRRLEDARGRYIEFCKSTFPGELDLKGLKIVLDCANGATYLVAPSVFEELGATVIKIHCEPDGININQECGSQHPNSLIKAIEDNQADLGIAFDGDGDRVIMVDSEGTLYNGDKLIYTILQAYAALGNRQDGIVGTVMTNMAMEIALKQQGYNFIRAKVGDRYVVEELLKNNWLIGGEASGHLLCLDKHSTGDGIVSSLQVIAGMVALKKSLKQIIDWHDYPQNMVNIRLNEDFDWQSATQEIVKEAQKELADQGRLVIRASGTEPLLRIMVEAQNKNLADFWVHKIANTIRG